MGLGGSRNRGKLLAGLAVLGAVWAFAAFATGSDAARLFQTRAVGDQLGQPADALILQLQTERRLSTTWHGGSAGRAGADRQSSLAAQRVHTDQAHAALARSAAGRWTRWAAGDAALERADVLLDRLRGLPDLRAGVDGHRLDRQRAAAEYTAVIDAAFRIYYAPRAWADPALARREDALVVVARAREVLSREDALVRGALAAGGLGDAERLRLGQLVGARRFLHAEAQTALPAADLARYRRLAADSRFTGLRAVEDHLVRTPAGIPDKDAAGGGAAGGGAAGSGAAGSGAAGSGEDGTETGGDGTGAPADALADWDAPADAVLAGLRDVVVVGSGETVDAAAPAGVGTIVRACLVGGLGLIALVAVFVMGLRKARTLGSGSGAGSGDGPAGGDGRPDPAAARDASGAELQALLLDLNRRNQALLHRQLRVLDTMERREADDEDLGDLFRADHLATQVRRNVEKLVALAGGAPARRWRRPVPMVDVVRAAAAEVAEYPRIAASEVEPAALVGTAVTDVSHLLAELMENSTVFSPAETRVRVSGAPGEDGYTVTVIDSGPGMSEDDLATAREVLDEPSPPAGGVWWGLYAVGRLADRHGITVTLSDAPGGGLIAEVTIPPALITEPVPETIGTDIDAGQSDTGPLDPAVPDVDDDGEQPPDPVRRTASGLPTRIRNATIPAPTPTTRSARSRAGMDTDRVARLRKRAHGSSETTELPVTPGGPDLNAADQQSTVGQPGRKSS